MNENRSRVQKKSMRSLAQKGQDRGKFSAMPFPEREFKVNDQKRNGERRISPLAGMMENVNRGIIEQGIEVLRAKEEAMPTKLEIGEPHDKYEQEADRVAKDVVQRIHAPQTSAMPNSGNFIARKLQKIPRLQCREAIGTGEASKDIETDISQKMGKGQPLDAALQQSMGEAMGADLTGVRVHTDSGADRLNQSLQAKAFTTGQNLFFSKGEYQPGSQHGQALIAHELTHVMQQTGGSNGPQRIVQCKRKDLPSDDAAEVHRRYGERKDSHPGENVFDRAMQEAYGLVQLCYEWNGINGVPDFGYEDALLLRILDSCDRVLDKENNLNKRSFDKAKDKNFFKAAAMDRARNKRAMGIKSKIYRLIMAVYKERRHLAEDTRTPYNHRASRHS